MIVLFIFFKSFWSAENPQKVASDRIAKAFNSFEGTPAEALDISKVFNKVGHVAFLHKLKSYIVSGQILRLILSFISNRLFYVVQHGKFVQEYPVINGWVPQGSILNPTVFLIYIIGLPDDVTRNLL